MTQLRIHVLLLVIIASIQPIQNCVEFNASRFTHSRCSITPPCLMRIAYSSSQRNPRNPASSCITLRDVISPTRVPSPDELGKLTTKLMECQIE